MNKEKAIKKLKEDKLELQDKIDIFNWYIKNEAEERICTFPQQLGNKEFKLSEQQIITANRPNSVKLLDYSINKIKEYLEIK